MGYSSTSISSCQSLMLPTVTEGSGQALHLESILWDLPLHTFEIELHHLGTELAQIFERNPYLPGAILVESGMFVGMVSRQRLLEYLIRPQGLELFLRNSLHVLHSYSRCEPLILSDDTPILVAAQQALRRSPDVLGDPIVVQQNETYYLLNVHELNIAHWQIRGIETQVRYERMQAQMIQSDKMASLGRLVDGIAHEILDPVSFIWGNLSHIASYSQSILDVLALYEAACPSLTSELADLNTELELDFVRVDLPRAIESVKGGAERLSKLASSLQNFCHIDEVYPKPTNLHDTIDSILLLLKSRLTSDIQIIKHYGYLPPVVCYPGHLNQVLMNILSTCLDSLLLQAVSQQLAAEMGRAANSSAALRSTIEITTEVCSKQIDAGETDRWVLIRIADNGPGLSKDAQRQLLESFSIKRRIEKETSLAVSYQIITAKHGGKFKVRSHSAANQELHRVAYGEELPEGVLQPNTNPTGTEFEIWLPLT